MSTPESAMRIYWTNVILIGNIFRRASFKIAAIDEFFVTHGADPAWWTKSPVSVHDSRHIDRVSGWLSGITRFAPEKTVPIMRAVLTELQTSGSIVSADDRQLVASQIERIDQFFRLPTATQRQPQLDQRVVDAAVRYWESGHYTKAVQNVFVALVTAVAAAANRPDLDGDSLMRHVFSQDTPILRISEVKSEQRGYMDLFAGSALAIRNPLSHTSEETLSLDEASELLSFASFLFRALSKAQGGSSPPSTI